MGGKSSKKNKPNIKEEEIDTYKYLENYEECNEEIIKKKEFICIMPNFDFSLSKIEIVTKFNINNSDLNTIILNDGSLARIIDNSLTIYNKNNFKVKMNIKAKNEIYSISQLQNNELIVIFEKFFMLYKIKKNQLYLLQKTHFLHINYEENKIIKNFDQVLELSNKSFIIKLNIQELETEKNPYAEYNSPTIYINIYVYNNNSKKYIFQRFYNLANGEISRIFDTFIMRCKTGSVYFYKDYGSKYNPYLISTQKYYPLRTIIEGKNAFYSLSNKHYVLKNKYFAYFDGANIEMFEFDEEFMEKKIKEIKRPVMALRNCHYCYNSENPVLFYCNAQYKLAFIQYDDNFDEIKKEDNFLNIKEKIYDIKIINNHAYILTTNYLYILKQKL